MAAAAAASRGLPHPTAAVVVAVLFALFSLHIPPTHDPAPSEEEEATVNYIVRFSDYRPAEEHRAYLERHVELPGWRWVERRNPAVAHPTDFGLVAVVSAVRERLVREFAGLGRVKDVWVDAKLTRNLLVGGEGGGGFGVEKRPGKMFTKMSFEENGLGNSSVNWSRRFLLQVCLIVGNLNFCLIVEICECLIIVLKWRMLLQRSQVTSMFGAETLWSQGFTGAKVKMAIFDTGIRSDHPHFRNIKVQKSLYMFITVFSVTLWMNDQDWCSCVCIIANHGGFLFETR